MLNILQLLKIRPVGCYVTICSTISHIKKHACYVNMILIIRFDQAVVFSAGGAGLGLRLRAGGAPAATVPHVSAGETGSLQALPVLQPLCERLRPPLPIHRQLRRPPQPVGSQSR